MRTISKSIVAAVAAMAVMALGASAASATITPTTGAVTATSTGAVTLHSTLLDDNCSTLNFSGDINMDNAAGLGGGGIITGWSPSGCLIPPTGTFTTPWTLNINSHVSGNTWTGTVTNVNVDISFCHFTGSLGLDYDNSTGRLTLNSGSLSGGACGAGSIVGSWDLTGPGGVIPQAS